MDEEHDATRYRTVNGMNWWVCNGTLIFKLES